MAIVFPPPITGIANLVDLRPSGDNTGTTDLSNLTAAIAATVAGSEIICADGVYYFNANLAPLTKTVKIRSTGTVPRTVNGAAFGDASWATLQETGVVFVLQATSGVFISDGGNNIAVSLEGICLKSVGNNTSTLVGYGLAYGVQTRSRDLLILNCAQGVAYNGGENSLIDGICTRGNQIALNFSTNGNGNMVLGWESSADTTAVKLTNAVGNTIMALPVQGFTTAILITGVGTNDNYVYMDYLETDSGIPSAVTMNGTCTNNRIVLPHVAGTVPITITVTSGNGNFFDVSNDVSTITCNATTFSNVFNCFGLFNGTFTDNGNNILSNWVDPSGSIGPNWVSSAGAGSLYATVRGPAHVAYALRTAAGAWTALEYRDDLGIGRLLDISNNKAIMTWVNGATPSWGVFGAVTTQPVGGSDVLASLVLLGLRAASANPPLDLGTGALTAGLSTFSGHIISSASGIPTTSTLGANVTSATFTGNDTRGTLTIVMAGVLAANTRVCTATFAASYGATSPKVTLVNQTSGVGLGLVNFYVQAQATGVSFDLAVDQALAIGTYTINYIVIG